MNSPPSPGKARVQLQKFLQPLKQQGKYMSQDTALKLSSSEQQLCRVTLCSCD